MCLLNPVSSLSSRQDASRAARQAAQKPASPSHCLQLRVPPPSLRSRSLLTGSGDLSSLSPPSTMVEEGHNEVGVGAR